LHFGIDVTLNAGLTIAMDPTNPGHLQVAAPTFIEPELKATAAVEGDIEVIGFDLASLSGGLTLDLPLAIGLEPGAHVDLKDVLQNLHISLNGYLYINIEADILGKSVWSWEPKPIHLFGDKSVVDTSDPVFQPSSPPVTVGGSDPVGPLQIDSRPNL